MNDKNKPVGERAAEALDNAADTVADKAEDAGDRVADATDRAGRKVKNAAHDTADKVEDATDSVRDSVGDAADRASRKANRAADKVDDVADSVQGAVGEATDQFSTGLRKGHGVINRLHRMGLRSEYAYIGGFLSIGISVATWAASRKADGDSKAQSDRWGIFVGHWAPTFFALGVALKLEEDD